MTPGEAREHLDELFATEVELEDEALDLLGLLDEAQARAAGEALDERLGERSDRTERRRVEATRARLAELDAALGEARRRRRQAVADLGEAEAAELRSQAASKRREADAREPRTRELLDALQEHEGVPYEPLREDRRQGGRYEEPVGVVRVHRPLTERLRREADRLETEADETAARRVRDRGSLDGARDADELVEAVRAQGPEVIGPTAPEVVAFVDEARAEADERLGRLTAENRRAAAVLLDLAWRDGEIDRRRSRSRIVEGASASV